MKILQFNYIKTTLLVAMLFSVLVSCERDLTDGADFATYSTTAEIFTDSPIAMGSDFYFPFGGSKPTAWTVDETEGYQSSASMRFDVPNANDPEGNYAGAIFRAEGPRNLTGYNALTFWAKASQGVAIDELGFGQDFSPNKFMVSVTGLTLSTVWTKYIIPIPDPSKLTQEKGMLWYAAGTQATGGLGYTFWLDDVKWENLGTLGQPQPAIMNGVDVVEDTFNGVIAQVSGLQQTFNLSNGINQTVNAAPSYFTFTSSDSNVAIVSELGEAPVVTAGTTVITATIGGVAAQGSYTLNSLGNFSPAPAPTLPSADVISVFSDAYTNVPVDFYNGFFGGSSTLGGAINVAGDNIISYTDLNFVSVQAANPTINASQATHIHLDINVQEALDANDQLTIELGDFGADSVFGGGNDSFGAAIPSLTNLVANQWVSIDIPLSTFTGGTGGGGSGLFSTSNIAQITFVSSTISNIYVDNIYFY